MTIRTLTLAAALFGVAACNAQETYLVQRGDSLTKIAKRFGIGPAELLKSNTLADPDFIMAGQRLVIPKAGVEAASEGLGKHVVRPGDTAYSIAKEHQVPASQLYVLNPSTEWTSLQVGDTVFVSGERAAQTEACPMVDRFYVVESGDSLSEISAKLNIPVSTLRSLNPGVSWHPLHVGEQVRIASGPAPRTVTVHASEVILRAGAHPGSRSLGNVARGTVLKFLRTNDDWTKVVVNGMGIGWVPSNLVKVDTEPMYAFASSLLKGKSTKVATSDEGAVEALIGKALQVRGVRYRWGGISRSGFDCSGFTSYVFAKMGIQLPRTSLAQSRVGQKVNRSELASGDLVFFRTRGVRISHVGIYVGDGKFIHASSGGRRVQVNSLGESYYNRRYAGARRMRQFARASGVEVVAAVQS